MFAYVGRNQNLKELKHGIVARALPNKIQVEGGTSQSKSGIFVNLGEYQWNSDANKTRVGAAIYAISSLGCMPKTARIPL